MTTEGEDRTHIERPRFSTPYFSYELQGTGEVRGLAEQALYGAESADIQLSADTEGIIGPVSLIRWNGRDFVSTFLKIPDHLAEDAYTFRGTDLPLPKFLMGEREKRGAQLKQAIKQHLSDTRNFDFRYNMIQRVRGTTILGTIATLDGPRIEFTFDPQTDAQFQRQLEDFLKLTFIYGGMLYEYAGLDEPHSRVVISPSTFTVESQRLSAARQFELLTGPNVRTDAMIRTLRGQDARQALENAVLDEHDATNPHTIRGENVIDFNRPSE